MLTVGNTVTVKVRNPLYDARERFANGYNGPEFNEYTGTVVHQKWFGDDKIGLTSDVRGVPVRVLSRHNIVEVMGAKFDYVPVKSNREVIPVKGSKGKTYNIIKENGKVSCSCPGYSYRKSCRHIDEVK